MEYDGVVLVAPARSGRSGLRGADPLCGVVPGHPAAHHHRPDRLTRRDPPPDRPGRRPERQFTHSDVTHRLDRVRGGDGRCGRGAQVMTTTSDGQPTPRTSTAADSGRRSGCSPSSWWSRRWPPSHRLARPALRRRAHVHRRPRHRDGAGRDHRRPPRAGHPTRSAPSASTGWRCSPHWPTPSCSRRRDLRADRGGPPLRRATRGDRRPDAGGGRARPARQHRRLRPAARRAPGEHQPPRRVPGGARRPARLARRDRRRGC